MGDSRLGISHRATQESVARQSPGRSNLRLEGNRSSAACTPEVETVHGSEMNSNPRDPSRLRPHTLNEISGERSTLIDFRIVILSTGNIEIVKAASQNRSTSSVAG
jgi:hypothetical protein